MSLCSILLTKCVYVCVCLSQSGEIRQFGDVISRRLGCRFADEETPRYLHSVSFMCALCALQIALFTQETISRNQYIMKQNKKNRNTCAVLKVKS